METIIAIRACRVCDKLLTGRKHQKFCGGECRTHYHNQISLNGNKSPYVRNINHALLRNRQILASVIPAGEEYARISKEKLEKLRFNFKYQTHIHESKEGRVFFYCYDCGYLPLENDWYLLVKRKED